MRTLGVLAAGAWVICAIASTAAAQTHYPNEFSPPKVLVQGTTAQPIGGPGIVTVQIQIDANGKHKVTKVLKSSNPADNVAAIELAQSATYEPGHRGTRPIASFYDYTFRFNGTGTSVAGVEKAAGGIAGKVNAAVGRGHYADAVSAAAAALRKSPRNPTLLQELAVAQYYDGNLAASAEAFSQVGPVGRPFRPLAAQAFAAVADQSVTSNPEEALAYARRAVALHDDWNAEFALGSARLANKDYGGAITALAKVAGSAPFANTNADAYRELVTSYLAKSDIVGATAAGRALATLDPTDDFAKTAMFNYYMRLGDYAMRTRNFETAFDDFTRAANTGAPLNARAYTDAAFAVLNMRKPDYAYALRLAKKALAVNSSDSHANFAAGVALAGLYIAGKDPSKKTEALRYLNEALRLALKSNDKNLILEINLQESQLEG